MQAVILMSIIVGLLSVVSSDRSVSHMRPLFCNISASRKRRGAYMQDLTFYLANTPPLPVPCLDVAVAVVP